MENSQESELHRKAAPTEADTEVPLLTPTHLLLWGESPLKIRGLQRSVEYSDSIFNSVKLLSKNQVQFVSQSQIYPINWQLNKNYMFGTLNVLFKQRHPVSNYTMILQPGISLKSVANVFPLTYKMIESICFEPLEKCLK